MGTLPGNKSPRPGSYHQNQGNQYGHVVLRGGGGKPNYDSVNIALCEQALEKAGLPTNIVVDCSHANSNKDHNVQPLVLDDITPDQGRQSLDLWGDD